MNKKNQFIGSILFNVLIYGLLIYAMSRTLHFVNNTMPGGKQIWGYLFLLATGGGAVIWKNVYLGKAKGFKQRALAFSMALIDLVAELLLVYADVMYVSGENGAIQEMTTGDLAMFINASVGIVGLNILAGFLFGLWDPETEQQERARDLVDDVTDAALKNLNTPEAKTRMIRDHAPMIEAAVMQSVLHQVVEMAGSYTAETRPLLPVNDELHAQTIHYPLQQAIPHPTVRSDIASIRVPQDVYQDLIKKYPRSNDQEAQQVEREWSWSKRGSVLPWHCKACDQWYVSDTCPTCGALAPELAGKDEPSAAGSPFPVG